MIRCLRAAPDDPGPNDEITWFLLQRFLEERIDEFIYGYREDLGIGRPVGAPKKGPLTPREYPSGLNLAQSEEIVRAHIPIKIVPKPSNEAHTAQEGQPSPPHATDA